ncbi:hypothetical protein RvY_00198-3 [Ramazzottius varieornatus]|uniref:Uncharacterized protein n=1 Tax=Ramazzottius varieornatus TaxID=947166 RepID=A0A1D1UBX8_RAMVA|nr:hypothetical protein RvY_00198-3 [Ramazzottius varieornatus]
MVAPTSMALAVLYRELPHIYERLGRMDRCVEAYKVVIPTVENLMDKYDQNTFDGLARLIVFHLERGEVGEAVPYIEKAWTRLQVIP